MTEAPASAKSLCRRETDAAASARYKRNLSIKQHSELSSSKRFVPALLSGS